MFDRENLIGVLLLGLCVAIGGVLVYSIATGTSFRYNGPGWLGTVIVLLFIGGSIFGLARSARRWPHPLAGRRRWWRRGPDDDSANRPGGSAP